MVFRKSSRSIGTHARERAGSRGTDSHDHDPEAMSSTDEHILDEITIALAESPSFDARGIEVHVEDGEVTLDGEVDSWESSRSAQDIAENVSGVIEVHNNLKVKP